MEKDYYKLNFQKQIVANKFPAFLKFSFFVLIAYQPSTSFMPPFIFYLFLFIIPPWVSSLFFYLLISTFNKLIFSQNDNINTDQIL